MHCNIHGKEMMLIRGKYYCSQCLAAEPSLPIRFENLSGLTKMPIGLRDNRLNNVLNPQRNIYKSLEKLLNDEEVEKLNFKVLWLQTPDILLANNLASGIANSRIISHLTSDYEYLDEVMFMNEEYTQNVNKTVESKFIVVAMLPFFIEAKWRMQLFYLHLRNLLLKTINNKSFIVIVSPTGFSEFSLNKAIENIFAPYKSRFKEIALKEKDFNKENK